MRLVHRHALRGLIVAAVALILVGGSATPGVSVWGAQSESARVRLQQPPAAFVAGSDARSSSTSRGEARLGGAADQSRDAELAKEHKKITKAVAERRKQIAAKLGYDPRVTDPHEMARQIAANVYGWGAGQYACIDMIITKESNWNPYARNPSSGAYGLPQALPGSKMASAGSDWRTNPGTQLRWGLKYMHDVYGTPCNAWAFHQSHNWY